MSGHDPIFENRFGIVQKNHSRKRKVFEEVKQLMVSTSIPILDRDNPVNCNSPTNLNQVYSQLLWSRLVYKRHKTARCKPRLKIWHLLISLFSLFSLFSHLCCVPLPPWKSVKVSKIFIYCNEGRHTIQYSLAHTYHKNSQPSPMYNVVPWCCGYHYCTISFN